MKNLKKHFEDNQEAIITVFAITNPLFLVYAVSLGIWLLVKPLYYFIHNLYFYLFKLKDGKYTMEEIDRFVKWCDWRLASKNPLMRYLSRVTKEKALKIKSRL